MIILLVENWQEGVLGSHLEGKKASECDLFEQKVSLLNLRKLRDFIV